jgi:serine/threonine-protein kinase
MSDIVSRLNDALRGRYLVEGEIGQGGMATVYLAADLKHDRQVALKVLKQELAAVIGAERFLAEIRTTAKLQHPHVLPLHDSGEADGLLFYVMPYVAGESLRNRLDRERQLPVEEAVAITVNLAEALDYAHRQGVVHRDIKPANVLLQDGKPVISDFGIALAVNSGGGDRLTETGLSLGTPHYMSPEQATGSGNVGVATDIYALGCVLYEMLVGDPPFTGSTAQAILGRIIMGDLASAGEERASVPPNVDAAIRRALEKVPADRFRDARDMAAAVSDLSFRHGAGIRAGDHRWRGVALGATVLAVVASTGVAWTLLRPEPPAPVERMAVAFREHQAPVGGFSLAPDGSRLLYWGPGEDGGDLQLWNHRWGDLEAVAVPGTQASTGGTPAGWSPTGGEFVFVGRDESGARVVRAVATDGGPPRTLASGYRATWGPDGRVYTTSDPDGWALLSVPSAGGSVDTVVSVDPGSAHSRLHLETFVPGMPEAIISKGEGARWHLWTIDLQSGELGQAPLARGWWATLTPTGHLVYLNGTTLMGARYDAGARTLGPSVPLVDSVWRYSLSDDGTLFYVSDLPRATLTPVWVDRAGNAREVYPDWQTTPNSTWSSVALSPDGRFLAISIGQNDLTDLWLRDLETSALRRLTDLDAGTQNPRWSADGRRLVFNSQATGRYHLWSMAVDGTLPPTPLAIPGRQGLFSGEYSKDGGWLVFNTLAPNDIYGIRVDGQGNPEDTTWVPLVTSDYREAGGTVSPSGRWIAYRSDEGGHDEVFVRPFPETAAAVTIVSVNGGSTPRWSKTGAELFYVSADGYLMAASFTDLDGRFVVQQRSRLFPLQGYLQSGYTWDVTPEGDAFVMLRINVPPLRDLEYVLVRGFDRELERLVPR